MTKLNYTKEALKNSLEEEKLYVALKKAEERIYKVDVNSQEYPDLLRQINFIQTEITSKKIDNVRNRKNIYSNEIKTNTKKPRKSKRNKDFYENFGLIGSILSKKGRDRLKQSFQDRKKLSEQIEDLEFSQAGLLGLGLKQIVKFFKRPKDKDISGEISYKDRLTENKVVFNEPQTAIDTTKESGIDSLFLEKNKKAGNLENIIEKAEKPFTNDFLNSYMKLDEENKKILKETLIDFYDYINKENAFKKSKNKDEENEKGAGLDLLVMGIIGSLTTIFKDDIPKWWESAKESVSGWWDSLWGDTKESDVTKDLNDLDTAVTEYSNKLGLQEQHQEALDNKIAEESPKIDNENNEIDEEISKEIEAQSKQKQISPYEVTNQLQNELGDINKATPETIDSISNEIQNNINSMRSDKNYNFSGDTSNQINPTIKNNQTNPNIINLSDLKSNKNYNLNQENIINTSTFSDNFKLENKNIIENESQKIMTSFNNFSPKSNNSNISRVPDPILIPSHLGGSGLDVLNLNYR